MLVLTRKTGESILIGDGLIEVTVVKVAGSNTVRLGITAPPDISIVRKEVAERAQTSDESPSS